MSRGGHDSPLDGHGRDTNRTLTSHAIAFAPGRVNLIGEHTDYNEGLALPFAISEGVTVRARGAGRAADRGRSRSTWASGTASSSIARARDGWRAFVRGAVAELRRRRRARRRRARDQRHGAARRRPVVLGRARGRAGAGAARAERTRRRPIGSTWPLCSRIENDWVGAQTGLLDQIASLFGEHDRALRIDFRSLDVQPVALELDGFSSSRSTPASTTRSPARATTSGARSARAPARRSASRACARPRCEVGELPEPLGRVPGT